MAPCLRGRNQSHKRVFVNLPATKRNSRTVHGTVSGHLFDFDDDDDSDNNNHTKSRINSNNRQPRQENTVRMLKYRNT